MEKTSFRVLIVEDHQEMLQVLSKFLIERGFEIDAAESGEVALDKIDSTRPDLVLLDVMLPGISGIDVAKEIRSNGMSLQDLRLGPTIILSNLLVLMN